MSRIAENLEWSLCYFGSDPAGSIATLEEMYRDDRPTLLSEAVRLLKEPGETPGTIGIAAFLHKKRELLPLLAHSFTPLPIRIRLATLGVRTDPGLTNSLADEILASPSEDDQQDLLEILGQTHPRLEVVNRLAGLLHHRNPRVHSKVALLLARVAPEGEWALAGMADPDPRVRANIVEALWKHKSAFAGGVFQRAADDPHHRVAANAIYGLYLSGDPQALPRIRQLLTGDGLERRAGLWLAERTADPRYLPLLGKLIGKVEPEARARCLKVIQAAKQRKAQAVKRGALQIDWLPRDPGIARVTITVDAGRRLTGLHPFDFVLHTAGQPIDDFTVQPLVRAITRTTVVLVGDCPDWKDDPEFSVAFSQTSPLDPGDRFGFLHFEKTKPGAAAPTPDDANFRLLGVEIEGAAPRTDSPPKPDKPSPDAIHGCGKSINGLRKLFDSRPPQPLSFDAALRQAIAHVAATDGEKHLVVLQQSGDPGSPLEAPPGIHLHVIASAPAPSERKNQGQYLVAQTAKQAAQGLLALHRGWLADHELRFPATANLDLVEIHSEWGFGSLVPTDPMVGAQGLEPRASSV